MQSIKSQMIIYLLVGILLLFGTVAYFVNGELSKLPSHIISQYQEIGDARAEQINKEIDKFIQEVKMVSQSPVVQSMDMEQIKEYLPSLVIEGVHRSMTVSKLDGIAWSTTGKEINITKQEQYQKIILENKPFWVSQPFISPYAENDMPIVIFSHEVKNNGELVGLVNIVIRNNFLNNVVKEINLGESGFAWIVDQHGKIVAHPDDSFVVMEYYVSDIISSWNSESPNFTIQSDNWFEHDNKITFFKEIGSSPDWTLLLSVNKNDIVGEVNNVRTKIYLAFVIGTLFITIFSFYYSNSIAKPILNLKEIFEKAETGDLSVVADESFKNEIGAAAKSFNQMLKQLKKLTYYDPLTNLLNLNGFFLHLYYRGKKNTDSSSILAITVVSIDDFKRINSVSGYKEGNQVLKLFSNNLTQFIKEEEVIGRYFGDEFILLLKEKSIDNLKIRIEALFAPVNTEIFINDNEYRLKLSVGVAYSTNYVKIDELVNQANVAKLQAKKIVGNHYQFYNMEIDEKINYEQKLEVALYHAINNKELYLAYQPILDLKSSKIIGTEALIRWKNEKYGVISPLKLIEIAERSGLIVEIGKWVLTEALKQNTEWQYLGYDPIFISVNISPIQFEQPNFVEMVRKTLNEVGMDPKYLELEITETNAMTFVEEKLEKMQELKEMGIRIAIDDFGTGYSSLAYFTKFPIHTLKIDRSFVKDLFHDDSAKTIITTIINLAKTINVATTAEGVEEQEQLSFLKSQGVDKIQGYLISKPISSEELEQLLKKSS